MTPDRVGQMPSAPRMIFIVGSRRSGTNWLQRVLTAHPDVAGIASETFLFSHGIKPLLERFHHGVVSSSRTGAMYADRADLVAAVRAMCDVVFAGAAERAGGPPYLIERTPAHAHELPLISEVYPDASVVHIIRDGRDVALSLLEQPWGPATIAEAAEEWRSSIVDARAGAPRFARAVEVRYEDLLAAPRRTVLALFAGLGLAPAGLDEALREAGGDEEAGTARHPRSRWPAELDEAAAASFVAVAGDLLVDLDYADRPWVEAARRHGRREAPGSGSVGAVARSVRAVARRLAAAGGSDAAPSAPEASYRLDVGAAVVDQFLSAIATRTPDLALNLLEPGCHCRVVAPAGEEAASGEAGRRLVEDRVLTDVALRGRQRTSYVLPGSPWFTVVASFEVDGEVHDRVLALSLDGESISGVELFVLPLDSGR